MTRLRDLVSSIPMGISEASVSTNGSACTPFLAEPLTGSGENLARVLEQSRDGFMPHIRTVVYLEPSLSIACR